MLSRSVSRSLPVSKLLAVGVGAALLALMFVFSGGSRAEAAGTQPVTVQADVSLDNCFGTACCSGYNLPGYGWVTILPGCNMGYNNGNACWNWGCANGNNCWNWGCGNNNCYNYSCNNLCYVANCGVCYYAGCGSPTYYGQVIRVAPIYGVNYGGYNNCAYVANYAYGFNNYCGNQVTMVNIDNPPATLACGTSNTLAVSAWVTYGQPYYGPVQISTTRGSVTSPVQVVNGRATTTLTLPAGQPGIVQVTAVAGGISDSVIIQAVC